MGKISNAKYSPRSDIICLEGNGARPSHKGNGWSVGGAMYTLNSTEVHCVCYAIDHVVTGGGNCTAQGKCWYEEVAPTLKSGGVHAVCYRIGSYYSNSMKSSNPHSGIYKTETSNTLDNMNCGYPACNQGGGSS